MQDPFRRLGDESFLFAAAAGPQPVAWRRRESHPLRQRSQGAPAPLAVIPINPADPASAKAGPGTPGCAALACRAIRIPLWSYQITITFPRRVVTRPQGRQDSNLRRAVLEAAVLAAELRPCEIENRPPGDSWGTVPAWPLSRFYVGTFSPLPGSIGCEKAPYAARSMPQDQVFNGVPFVVVIFMLNRLAAGKQTILRPAWRAGFLTPNLY